MPGIQIASGGSSAAPTIRNVARSVLPEAEEGVFYIFAVVEHRRVADLQDYLRAKCLKWNGDPDDLLFRVQWMGFTSADDTWEPMSYIYSTKPFMEYFRKYLVPDDEPVSMAGTRRTIFRAGTR
uniref:Chromo domain-containing protein n=1 Tax=Panagrellus redivivus TaxID=6233 RepID=A0A7E4ZQ16_PANRE